MATGCREGLLNSRLLSTPFAGIANVEVRRLVIVVIHLHGNFEEPLISGIVAARRGEARFKTSRERLRLIVSGADVEPFEVRLRESEKSQFSLGLST